MTAVAVGAFMLNSAHGAEVSDWNGLKDNSELLVLTGDINVPTDGSYGNLIRKTIAQTIDGKNFTINGTDGRDYGYIQAKNNADLTLKNLTVSNFSNTRLLTTDGSAILNITDSKFKDNSFSGGGGALYFGSTASVDDDGNKITNIKLKNVTFEDNTAIAASSGNGGAIYLFDNNKMELDNVTFKNNSARNNGIYTSSSAGALYISNGNEVIIKDSHFEGNSTDFGSDGGAIFLAKSKLTIDNTKFIDNKADYCGGAIQTESSPNVVLKITNSEFKGNHSRWESGALYGNGSLDIYNTIFDGNYTSGTSAGSEGGAIKTNYYDYSLRNNIILSTFKNNHADDNGSTRGAGGAIFFYAPNDNNTLVDTIFTGNQAHEGGAIYMYGATLNIFADTKDVEFTGNIARADDFTDLDNSYNGGGAIYFDRSDLLSLNASEGRKIVFNDTIASYGNNTISINKSGLSYTNYDDTEVSMGNNTGEIQFNNYVGDNENIFNIELYNGTLSIGQNSEKNADVLNPDGYINFNKFYIKGDSILNTVNNIIGEFAPQEFKIDDGINWEYQFDIDLANKKSDKIVVTENKGNLNLSKLNIISDTTDKEVQVKYSDTNINGQLKDDYQITTSTATYNITAENNDTDGSSLLFKSDSSADYKGLAGAIINASDVYSNTLSSDEIVNEWYKNENTLKADLIVNANNKGIVAGVDDLDGIVTDKNYTLTVNDAKDFSGFNVAIDNTNGTINLNNSNFTGNKGDTAIKNKDGEINITASSRNVLFDNPDSSSEIQSDGGSVNIQGSNSVTFAGKLIGSNDAKLDLNANNVIFKDEISGFNVRQKSGNSDIESITNSVYT